MSIRQRGAASVAALTIVVAVMFAVISPASAQTDYQPSTKSSDPAKSSSSASGTALPRTGSNSTIPMAQFGVLLVVAGGFLVIIARKRSHSERESVDA